MNLAPGTLDQAARVLDVGGWFKPEPRATHVVDLMPWETRGAKLQLQRLPEERFSKDTWRQADFLSPDFRLPFEDKSFDVVLCGQTVEDLANPGALLREMSRVGVSGIIECPSRLHEQTAGVRDRKSTLAGHPHHHWIVEGGNGSVMLYSKADSGLDRWGVPIPLSAYERRVRESPGAETLQLAWRGTIEFKLVTGLECAQRALEFARQSGSTAFERLLDAGIRTLRRVRDRVRGGGAENFGWWDEIVRASEPFSSIKLK